MKLKKDSRIKDELEGVIVTVIFRIVSVCISMVLRIPIDRFILECSKI